MRPTAQRWRLSAARVEAARRRIHVFHWGRDFLHCPYCHGWEVRDQPIGVIGIAPGSVEHAQLLRQWSDDVIFFAHSYAITASDRTAMDARGIRIVDGEVTGFSIVNDRLEAVQLADGCAIPRTAVFIRPALHTHDDGLIASLGCELDATGLVRVDAVGRTSVPGVWAAGNASNPRAQVITAVGEGSAAAIAINTDLVEEDVRSAVQMSVPVGHAATATAPEAQARPTQSTGVEQESPCAGGRVR